MKTFAHILLFLTVTFIISGDVFAQDKPVPTAPPPVKKAVIFKIPENLTPNEMVKPHKGLLMLDLKSPSGLFIAYTPDEQKSEDYIPVVREMMAKFFIHDKDVVFQWKETVLPSEKFPNETGKIMTTDAKDKEVQIVVYTRTIALGQDVVYGYFAMRNMKAKGDSAEFADGTGQGIKYLEKFRKKLAVSK